MQIETAESDLTIAGETPLIRTDTIGAGDRFNAGFLAGYLRGAGPIVCAQAGNVAGALSTLDVCGTEAFRDPARRSPSFVSIGPPRNSHLTYAPAPRRNLLPTCHPARIS